MNDMPRTNSTTTTKSKTSNQSKNDKPVVLIMAGGKGERFWPRSTITVPKQLQKIYSNKTLLQETIDRAKSITSADRIFIGCNATLQKAIIKTHRISAKNFIVEPEGKNTAAIIALAALHFEKKFPNSVHVILSADHFIEPLHLFQETMELAVRLAKQDRLVTCGIRPTRPDTGYGYIQPSKTKIGIGFPIEKFHEKPAPKLAQKYVKKGYLWNSGIFVWRGAMILDEFRNHAADIIGPLESCFNKPKELAVAFQTIPELPIDIAIMERSKKSSVIPALFQWDDVGSWLALERIHSGETTAADKNNVFTGGVYRILLDSDNNIIVPNSKRLIALLGVNDMIYVETETAVLLAAKDSIDDIKQLMGQLKENPALHRFLK